MYAWADLRRDLARVRKRGGFVTDWSCARSRQIRRGDRLFLLRQGVEPRGIVASGWATSDWYEGPGWRRAGVPCNYVDWNIDVLRDAEREPILPREALSHGVLGSMYWNTQVSGIRIPAEVAHELEKAWRAVKNLGLKNLGTQYRFKFLRPDGRSPVAQRRVPRKK